jgi:hypothetical protein
MGADDFAERILPNGTVVRDLLDPQQAPVGLKADLPQCRQVLQLFADAKIARIVDGGLGAKRTSLFVILLDSRVFVLDVQRRDDTVGNHASTEPAWCSPAYSAIENELYLARLADVEILPNDFLEKHSTRHRAI